LNLVASRTALCGRRWRSDCTPAAVPFRGRQRNASHVDRASSVRESPEGWLGCRGLGDAGSWEDRWQGLKWNAPCGEPSVRWGRSEGRFWNRYAPWLLQLSLRCRPWRVGEPGRRCRLDV